MVQFTAKIMDSPKLARPSKQNVATGKLAIDQTPLRARPATAGLFVRVRNANLPISVYGTQRSGPILEQLMRFIYNRIHVNPSALVLGNVVSSQERQVRVWNAYFEPHTLESFEQTDAEGIAISGQPDAPLSYGALSERTYTVTVSTEGPPVVNASLNWKFDIQDLTIAVTGSRITIFSFAPTWEGGITETLEWRTTLAQGPLGTEQRRSIRIAPRRFFELKLIANKRERAYMDIAMFNWGNRNWAIPIWPDVQELRTPLHTGDLHIPCNTAGRDFTVGGLVCLRGRDAFTYEAREIAQIDGYGLTLDRPILQDWNVGTKIYPVRTARFSAQPQHSRLTDQNSSVSVKFMVMEPCDWPAIPPTTTYRGYPVFATRPEESEDLTNTYLRLVQTIENNTGLPLTVDTAGLGFTARAHRWLMHGIAQHTEVRNLLYYLAGQWKSLWVPTHNEDMVVNNRVIAGSTALDIEWIGYSRFGVGQPQRMDVMITMRNGTVYFRRILDAQEIDADTERVGLDTAIPVTYDPKDFLRISFMALSRLDQDSVEIQHETDIEGVGSAKVVFRSLRDDI